MIESRVRVEVPHDEEVTLGPEFISFGSQLSPRQLVLCCFRAVGKVAFGDKNGLAALNLNAAPH
jgi:hypothetical protein